MKPDFLVGLERVHSPPDFARLTAQDIALSARLEALGVRAPADFAARVAARIHSAALESPLVALMPISAPPNFAAFLAQRIARDAVSIPALESLPAVHVPDGFAPLLAARIENDAGALPALSTLPRVAVPHDFAQTVIARINDDIGAELETNDRAPLYFIAALLGSVAVALLALTWPYASTAGTALLEILRVLPNAMLAPVIAVALLAMVGAASSKVQWRLPAGLLAFAVAAVAVVPQSLPFFGNAQVSGETSSVVRFAGDIVVRGLVDGDVIAIGGNVRLVGAAKVTGRVLTFLGDVNLPRSSSVATGINAVLGVVNDASALEPPNAQSLSLPGLSAASALRPLRALVTAGTWQWWYFALLVALGSALVLLPHLRHALQKPLRFQTGRSLSLGLLLLFITAPAVALGGLSLIGAPAALLLGVFTLLVFSSGAALALTELGALLLQACGITRRAGLWRIVPSFALFGAALLYPPLALALWLLFGAWGAGALLIALRDGELVASLNA